MVEFYDGDRKITTAPELLRTKGLLRLLFSQEAIQPAPPRDVAGPGNISANRRFINLRRFNFALRPDSPAIDAGTRAVPGLPRRDFAGEPRVVDGDQNGTGLPDNRRRGKPVRVASQI